MWLARIAGLWNRGWRTRIAILSICAVLIGTAAFLANRFVIPREPLHIAVAMNLTGESSESYGKEALRAVQLCIDAVNQAGGVHGRPVRLDVYDDEANVGTARTVAGQIGRSRALLVLGHLVSTNSGVASPTYRAYSIPAIAPFEVANSVTQSNPYYFRTVYDNTLQGQFAAQYVYHIFKKQTVSVIYSADPMGVSLTEAFNKGFAGQVLNKWGWSPRTDLHHEELHAIVEQLAAGPKPDVVFLPLVDADSSQAVMAIRARGLTMPILVSHGSGMPHYVEYFKGTEQERRQPGFFTKNLYLLAPMLFDSAGEDAQAYAEQFWKHYAAEPSWVGALTYDATRLAVKVLEDVNPRNTEASRDQDRERIRERLARFDRPETAAAGISGPIYFNHNRSVPRPVRVGEYVGDRLITAPEQLTNVASLDTVDVAKELAAGNLIQLKDRYMWRQRVVYTGLYLNELRSLDFPKSIFLADFYLWLRYTGDDSALAFDFPEAVNSRFNPDKPQKQGVLSGLQYRLYRLEQEMRANYDLHDYPFDIQRLPIRIRNTRLPREQLVYTVDMLGGGGPGGMTVAAPRAVGGLPSWALLAVRPFQESFVSQSALGDERLVKAASRLEYSGVTIAILLKRNARAFLVKSLLPLLLLGLILFMTLFLPSTFTKERMAAATTAILTAVVLLTGLRGQTGEVGYTVAIEYGFYVFFGLCMCVIGGNMLTERLHTRNRSAVAIQLQMATRAIFIAGVLMTVLVYWFLFGRHAGS